jgi:hypothetical protein
VADVTAAYQDWGDDGAKDFDTLMWLPTGPLAGLNVQG